TLFGSSIATASTAGPLHRHDRPEPDLAPLDPLVGLADLFVSLCQDAHLAARGERKRLVKVFAAFVSTPMTTSRPSGRSPWIESAIASAELLVPSTTSAPPARERPWPSRTISSAPYVHNRGWQRSTLWSLRKVTALFCDPREDHTSSL